MIAPTPPEPELGLLLRLAYQRAAKAFNSALLPLEIEARHFGVLLILGRAGPQTQSQLVGALNNDKSSMVRTVDDLERLGLCVRQPVPGDRRARTVELTALGRERLARAKRIAARVSDELFAGLSSREQATMRDLLTRFIDGGGAPAS